MNFKRLFVCESRARRQIDHAVLAPLHQRRHIGWIHVPPRVVAVESELVGRTGHAATDHERADALAYVLDQTLWVDCCNENRNVRIFSVWSLADGNPSLYRWSGNLSLESKGLFCGRDQDRAGVGYFYEGLSSNFKQLVSPVADVEDVQGVEIYYNAAITPWFHLTADLQIIDNENAEDDTAIILGLRANIAL